MTASARPDASSYVIRRPAPGDAEPFATLHVHIWQVTYEGIMNVQALTLDRFLPMWQSLTKAYAAGAVLDDGREFWVATDAEANPAGFLLIGPPRDEDPPAPRQLYSLNVAPEHQGTGVAQRLVDECFGAGPAYLWVAQGNERAIRFYQRNGFELDGVSSVDQHDGVTELRMVRGDAVRPAGKLLEGQTEDD